MVKILIWDSNYLITCIEDCRVDVGYYDTYENTDIYMVKVINQPVIRIPICGIHIVLRSQSMEFQVKSPPRGDCGTR